MDDFNKNITNYFQRYFKNDLVDTEVRLVDLGFESMDYIELASFLLETMHKWLDISKINNATKISDIFACLLTVQEEETNKKRVKLDKIQQNAYSYEFHHNHPEAVTYIIHYLNLQESIDIPKLEEAIRKTLDNHYLLNSKLTREIDDYYFDPAPKQSSIYFKGSVFFPERDIVKLRVTIHAERLVNIYLQRKKKQYYLIIAFHHIAMDGWSNKIILEEIFRRYADLYPKKQKNPQAEIQALNRTYHASLNEPSNPEELKKIFNAIDPEQFYQLDHLFYGTLQFNSSCLVVTTKQMKQYADKNHMNGVPLNVIITVLLYNLLCKVSGSDKLTLYTSLSNRFLPIPGIRELVTNLATGLPLFLEQAQLTPKQFAETINETLKIYFKHMSYGAITRILLEGKTLLNQYISPYHQPYYLMLTYMDDMNRTMYGNDSIVNHYIHWPKSKTYICTLGRLIFFHVEHLNDNLVINIHSSAAKGVHTRLLHQLKTIFPDILLS